MLLTALHLGKKFNTKELNRKFGIKAVSKDPLILQFQKGKYITLLKYGVVVFIGYSNEAMEKHLLKLLPHTENPFPVPSKEIVKLKTNHKLYRVGSTALAVPELSPKNVAIMSLVLGRSVALEYYEKELEKVLSELDSVISAFAEKGRSSLSSKKLMKKAATSLYLRQLMVTELSLLDKPDLTWEDQSLDEYYKELAEEFELDERYRVLGDKTETISHTTEFILDYLNARQSFWMEFIIIALILLEVVVFIYEIWAK